MNRDDLGRIVRKAWVRWARMQPDPKPSWLVPYDELSEADKEADRQIGEAVASETLRRFLADVHRAAYGPGWEDKWHSSYGERCARHASTALTGICPTCARSTSGAPVSRTGTISVTKSR
jgi:hypothetical protein